MRKIWFAAAAKVACVMLMAQGDGALAAEIKVIGLIGLRPVMVELGSQFERSTSHKLVMQYGSAVEGKSVSRPAKHSTLQFSILISSMI